MVQKFGKLTSWYVKSPGIYKVLAPSQGVVWDFWTINSLTTIYWIYYRSFQVYPKPEVYLASFLHVYLPKV